MSVDSRGVIGLILILPQGFPTEKSRSGKFERMSSSTFLAQIRNSHAHRSLKLPPIMLERSLACQRPWSLLTIPRLQPGRSRGRDSRGLYFASQTEKHRSGLSHHSLAQIGAQDRSVSARTSIEGPSKLQFSSAALFTPDRGVLMTYGSLGTE